MDRKKDPYKMERQVNCKSDMQENTSDFNNKEGQQDENISIEINQQHFQTTSRSTNENHQSDDPGSEWCPEVLVLGPGGVKGFLELGALILLESEGYLKNITTYVGVSIGAIISLLLVTGYTVTEIISDAIETNLFQDLSSINFEDIKENTGLLSNRPIKEKLITRLEDKFGFVPNLEQLYMVTGLEFMCVTMNLSKDRAEYISRHTDPSMNSVDAVLLSSNIPLLFYKLKYKGSVYIDGAFGNPYPVDQYDDGSRDILGIYITSGNPERKVPEDFHIAMYLYKIIDSSMIQIRDRIIQSSSTRCKHLRLYSPTVDATGLTVDMKVKSQMVLHGYYAAKKFIEDIKYPNKDIIIVGSEPDSSEEIVTYDETYSSEQDYTDQPIKTRRQLRSPSPIKRKNKQIEPSQSVSPNVRRQRPSVSEGYRSKQPEIKNILESMQNPNNQRQPNQEQFRGRTLSPRIRDVISTFDIKED